MTIAVDFDGVIHAYSKGWQDGTIYDPPLPGALEGIRALMKQDAVFIFTSRNTEQVADWLFERGDFSITWEPPGEAIWEFWSDRDRVLVTNRKLPATAYLDDRAVRFENWDQALTDLTPKEQRPMNQPRRFHLHRTADITGVSGTGRVADGILWPDGTASVRWTGERPSIVFWDGGIADAEHVHGHGGNTVIVWDDPEPAPVDTDCTHCPDGHTPADQGSQPWNAYVGPEQDGDGQPTTIHVARSGGAHVAESDADWIRQRLNPADNPRPSQPIPFSGTGRLNRGA